MLKFDGPAAKIVMIGNPIMDISYEDAERKFLEKYKLELGLACLASEEQMPIYQELFELEGRQIIPGGSALNSARSAQHIFNKTDGCEHRVAYFGCIGHDDFGKALEQSVAEEKVYGYFCHDADTTTGTCGVVVCGKERTLCANLGACTKFTTEHLKTHEEVLTAADVIYTTGFFVTSNREALMWAAEHACSQNKIFGFNLSAPFLIQFERAALEAVLPYADYVFCNEDEQAEMAKAIGVENIGEWIAKIEKKNAQRPKRHVIMTQGPAPTQVTTCDHSTEEKLCHHETVEVPALDKDAIVDTNGAGDSFVGAFFAGVVAGEDLRKCVQMGNELAGHVVQRSGCQFA